MVDLVYCKEDRKSRRISLNYKKRTMLNMGFMGGKQPVEYSEQHTRTKRTNSESRNNTDTKHVEHEQTG